MPVYLLTLHAYRSWSEDNPRGYVQQGRAGIQPAHRGLAAHRAAIATHPPRRFTPDQRRAAVEAAIGFCKRRKLTALGSSCTPTHLHLLASWPHTAYHDAHDLAGKLKRIVACVLSKHDGTTGNKWFSGGSDEKRVADRKHLGYLLADYLPKHRREGGVVLITEDAP